MPATAVRDDDLDAALRALAHPARRRLLRLAAADEHTSSDLAAATGLPRPATSQHLRTLRDAGLVAVRVDGGHRFYRARRARLDAVVAALAAFWDDRLARLEAALTEEEVRP